MEKLLEGKYASLHGASSTGDAVAAAIRGRNLEKARQLLDEAPELLHAGDARSNQPIHWAVMTRQLDIIDEYLGCGAPLKNAAAAGHIEIVELLLARGADPNLPEEGIAPHGHALYSAVYNGHFDIARLLLEHGAYSNPEVESSADALSIAIMNSDKKMIELLASYGATWRIAVQLADTAVSK